MAKTSFEKLQDNGLVQKTSAEIMKIRKDNKFDGVQAILHLCGVKEFDAKTKATLAPLRKGDSKHWKNNQDKFDRELHDTKKNPIVYVLDVEKFLRICPGVINDAGENVHPEGCRRVFDIDKFGVTMSYHCPVCQDVVNKKAKGKTATTPEAKLDRVKRAKALLDSFGIADEKYDEKIAELKAKLNR